LQDSLFYLFSTAIVVFSLLVVTLRNLLHSALALIAAFGVTAGLYILLHAEFVAAAQVMVYIGGIVIFIVFAILLTTKLGEKHLSSNALIKGASVFIATGVFIPLALFFYQAKLTESIATSDESGSLEAIGLRLMNIGTEGFIVPFEIISVLLLAAVIGAITVARKGRATDIKDGVVK